MELQPIQKEVVSLLQAFGYKPEVKTYHATHFKTIVEISFPVNNGFETMPTRHKDAIAMLVKGYLSEFYYEQDTQYIRLYYNCKGLDPDDSRYACLLHELRLVNSEHLCKPGTEVFVNMGDHFKRLVNWTDVTSID